MCARAAEGPTASSVCVLSHTLEDSLCSSPVQFPLRFSVTDSYKFTQMEPPTNPGEGPVELEFTVQNLESVSYCYWYRTLKVDILKCLSKYQNSSENFRKFFVLKSQ